MNGLVINPITNEISNNNTLITIDNSYNTTNINTITGIDIINDFVYSKKKESTKKDYLHTITEYCNVFLQVAIQNVTIEQLQAKKKDIINYRKYLENKVDGNVINNEKKEIIKESSANTKLRHIKSFYTWLINNRDDYNDSHYDAIDGVTNKVYFERLKATNNTNNLIHIKSNPFSEIEYFTEDIDEEGSDALTIGEINMILAECDNDKKNGYRNKLMIELSLNLAIRRTALCTLQLSDFVRNEDGTYLCNKRDKFDKKNKKNVSEAMYNKLVEFFENSFKKRYIIDKWYDSIFGLSDTQFNNIIKKLSKKCGINKKITAHSLKISGASIAGEIFSDLDTAAYLGHSDVNISKRYFDKKFRSGNSNGIRILDMILGDEKSSEGIGYSENKSNIVEKNSVEDLCNIDNEKVETVKDIVDSEMTEAEQYRLMLELQKKFKNVM